MDPQDTDRSTAARGADEGPHDDAGSSSQPSFFTSGRVRRVVPTEAEGDAAARGPVRPSGQRTWLEGSGTTRAWNSTVLAYAAVSVGGGILLSAAARLYAPGAVGQILASLALWVGMAVPVALAIVRSRPRGLFRFRWTDILWGLGLGLLLRVVQGWLEVAAGGTGGLPSSPTLDGGLGPLWPFTGVIAPVVIAPVVEELLFRGVILVTVYRTAKRGLEAGILAVAASTALFVGIHAVDGVPRWDEPVYLTLVGVVTGVLVLSTGRIWGAVLVHAVFNAIWVVLAAVGTALA